jgi:two-component system chemotaxis response regulator CheY
LARKILLADDSVTAQNMGRKILADAGYEVITVNNGSAALKKIADAKPDIIILDVYMPGYSGLEVCQRLKDAQETSRIPVMLTVGKLEPFKPEEAKRVRAEGYIVKPFEASELLSALSKLEDKIVPRAEASKPGRFARANAALDEGKYDKSVAIEEDTGWKNRIGFPSKNKKAAREDDDDSTIYNAVNKDLKTVVERKLGEEQREAKKEESRFDLGALAPEGLPNNVTPEEIAALAAAAAQVKGSLAESAATENLPDLPAPALADAKAAEVAKEVAASEVPAVEAKAEAVPTAEPSKESEVPAATFAAQKPEEPAQPAAAKLADAVQDSGVSMPSPAEMMAAIAGLVPDSGQPSDASSGNGTYASADQSAKEKETAGPADEPVTRAAAAGAGSGAVASRWTAVAVALAPEESSISLEQEMQKAHAAFAAADAHAAEIASAPAAVETTASEISSLAKVEEPVVAAAHEPEMARSGASAQAEQAQPEVAQNEIAPAETASVASSLSSPATEAVSAAVREFERVAASFVAPQHQPLPESQPEAPAVESGLGQASVSPSAAEVPPVVEAAAATAFQSESTPTEAASAPVYDFAPAPGQESPVAEEAKFEELKSRESKLEDSKAEDSKTEESKHESKPAAADGESATEESKREEWKQADSVTVAAISASASEEVAVTADKIETAAPDFDKEMVAEKVSGIPSFSSPLSSAAQQAEAPVGPSGGGTRDIAKKESEIAETTAAAWASWRRIRETGDSKNAPGQPAKAKHGPEEEKSAAHDESAMAVAAGAENNPEEAPAAAPQDTGEIASIVDSMLADLRPKMMEEITRKLGKKK